MGLSYSIARGKTEKGKTFDFCTFSDPTHMQLTQSSYIPVQQKKCEYIMSSDPKQPLSFSGKPFKFTENETIFCDRQVHKENDSSEA